MSEIKVNSIKGVSASTAAISIDNSSGTCTANITNRTNRNLVVNGACLIAQRSTSSTANAYGSVDRFKMALSNVDENPTQAQADVASGTTPYSLGFRKAFKVTNGNQTSGAQTGDVLIFTYNFEAQDIANSGWNYTSSSSNITLSFWVKSSVAQNFFVNLVAFDGTVYSYTIETGSLSADTWTKVTKTISGNSNLTFDNDNGVGTRLEFILYRGTSFTGSVTLNQWAAYDSSNRNPDCTSTWYTTNDATFEVTGLQVEVSDHATDFEHRSFGQELALCQRYYYRTTEATTTNILNMGVETNTAAGGGQPFPTTMRASPSITFGSGLSFFSAATSGTTFSLTQNRSSTTHLAVFISISGATAGQAGSIFKSGSDGYIEANAEL